MNLVEHRSLWSAIQQFPLDDPDAAISFSRKLAAQQNWSPAFTPKAIDEYRKFIFLCCIAPKGASPSKTVDEVWHLHLTYTQSYWVKLCKETLGKDIHHHPSRGGEEEDHKHEQWYADTLQLYETVFESPPPADIWPPPKEDLAPPVWRISKQILALIFLLLSIPLVIIGYKYHQFFPFALKGPQFLDYFRWLALSSLVCFVIIQHDKNRLLKELVNKHFPFDANIFQLTLFLYGRHRAVQTAMVDLIRRNLLELAHDHFFWVNKSQYTERNEERNPLIDEFLKEEKEAVNYDMIVFNWYDEKKAAHRVLLRLYQLAYQKESLIKRWHILLLPFIIGMMRMFQGIANDKPVSNLAFHMGLLLFIAAVVGSFCSKARSIFKKAKRICREFNWLHPDDVVNEFAFKGNEAIKVFSDGLILMAIFAAYPVMNHTKVIDIDTDYGGFFGDGACSSGGGCSGGGCGGGGCGGCGS